MNTKEFLEANGITKASLEASIARDREWLEKIEPVIRKAAQSLVPLKWKIASPLRGLKRTLLHTIKVSEKLLAQISKADLK